MIDEAKTKAQLLDEVRALRQQVAALQAGITTHEHAKEVLHDRDQCYRIVSEMISDYAYAVRIQPDWTYTVEWFTKTFTRVTGYTLERGPHSRDIWKMFIHPDDLSITRERGQKLMAGQADASEFRIITKSGEVRWVQEYGRPVWDEAQGRVTQLYIAGQDITERKRMEETLRQAKESLDAANRAKSEFLATMSHELRTPLTVILGYTSFLLDGTVGRLEGKQGELLRSIDRNALELLELITAVLDLSRLEAGRLPVELRAVQVPELVKELEAEIREVREHVQLEFAWQVEAELPLIQTDPGKLKVVLKNLIRNAVKFTPEGRITVVARNHRDGVEVRVQDTGIGIPQEALELIFEPFRQLENATTRQSGGTGLGLHIVKRLLEILGGTITVESEVGRGSTFCVWVPKQRAEQRNRAETNTALRERGLQAARSPSSSLTAPHSQTRPGPRLDQSSHTRRR